MATPQPPSFGTGETFSKVDISVTCQNLKDLDYFSKSDPCVFLFEYLNRSWAKIGRTEVIDNNLNPKVRSQQNVREDNYYGAKLIILISSLLVVQQDISASVSVRRDPKAQVCCCGH